MKKRATRVLFLCNDLLLRITFKHLLTPKRFVKDQQWPTPGHASLWKYFPSTVTCETNAKSRIIAIICESVATSNLLATTCDSIAITYLLLSHIIAITCEFIAISHIIAITCKITAISRIIPITCKIITASHIIAITCEIIAVGHIIAITCDIITMSHGIARTYGIMPINHSLAITWVICFLREFFSLCFGDFFSLLLVFPGTLQKYYMGHLKAFLKRGLFFTYLMSQYLWPRRWGSQTSDSNESGHTWCLRSGTRL